MPTHATALQTLEGVLRQSQVDWFLLPMGDEFQSEYTPEAAKRLPYVTGFDGSAGFGVFRALPTEQHPHTLFVDGRYTLQAAQQVTAPITIRNSGEMPITSWLQSEIAVWAKDVRIGFDPWLLTHRQMSQWQEATKDMKVNWVPLDRNPVDTLWKDRPLPPTGGVALHPLEYAGDTYLQKRDAILKIITQKKADAQLLCLPDGINWLLNIRGSDVAYNPLLLCYFLLFHNGDGILFMHPRDISSELREYLATHRIQVENLPFLSPPSLSTLQGRTVLADPTSTAESWWNLAAQQKFTLIEAPDPTLLPKACKNTVELAGITAAHVRDGLALTRFLCWLDQEVAQSRWPSELEIVDRLESFRKEHPLYRGASFATIAGSGPHGAIVHYRADAQSNRRLAAGELFLLDSGGQYPDGTTDVTRTVAIGEPDATSAEHFTRVLKGHIALARARFPSGTTGAQLDALARQYLWEVGLDYDHGTGHGVGAYLCVHEGPQRISKYGNATTLKPGMIISNEPGYYLTGAYGIRIENLVAVAAGAHGWLHLETLTLAPIDIRLVNTAMLTTDERAWLNAYHKRVFETHAPHFSNDEKTWLKKATQAI